MREKIVVLRLNEEKDQYRKKQIPLEMVDETFNRIGSEFDKRTGHKSKEIIRGLNNEQEKLYLPSLIGVSSEDLNFASKARDFWADFTISPTKEGLRLNIATESKASGKVDGEGKALMIDVPVNLDDYMYWQFAKQSSKVATTPDEIENKGTYEFILEDLSVIKEKEMSEFEARDSATLIYSRLTSKFADNIDKIDWILEMTKKQGQFFDSDLEMIDKKMLLKKLSDERPLKLIALYEDKDLEDKALLNKLLTYLIITKEGNDYYYQNENMGSEEKGALSWIRKPEKSAQLAAMKSRLEEAIKMKKTN